MTIEGGLRAAVRSVRGRAPIVAERAARLGRAADRPSARLFRAALHLRRFRSARGGRRRARHLDQLSRPHARRADGGPAGGLAALVRLLPLGGSSRRPPAADRANDRAWPRALGRERQRPGDAQGARRDRLRARRAALERGVRASALRAPLRGGPHRGGAAQVGGARRAQCSARR